MQACVVVAGGGQRSRPKFSLWFWVSYCRRTARRYAETVWCTPLSRSWDMSVGQGFLAHIGMVQFVLSVSLESQHNGQESDAESRKDEVWWVIFSGWVPFSAHTLLVGYQEGCPARRNTCATYLWRFFSWSSGGRTTRRKVSFTCSECGWENNIFLDLENLENSKFSLESANVIVLPYLV